MPIVSIQNQYNITDRDRSRAQLLRERKDGIHSVGADRRRRSRSLSRTAMRWKPKRNVTMSAWCNSRSRGCCKNRRSCCRSRDTSLAHLGEHGGGAPAQLRRVETDRRFSRRRAESCKLSSRPHRSHVVRRRYLRTCRRTFRRDLLASSGRLGPTLDFEAGR